MLHRVLCAAVCLLASAARVEAQPPAPVAGCAAPSSDLRGLIRRVAATDQANQKRMRDYTYVEHQVDQKLDKDGRVSSSTTETHEILVLDGEFVERLIARDDKPLSASEAKKEEERINKWLEKRKNEGSEERQKRLAAEERQRNQEREFEGEIADAFDFKQLPDESIDGRAVWVVDGNPLPHYHPRTPQGRILPRFHFRVWIEQQQCQFIKLDAEVISTVPLEFSLARMYPGTRLQFAQTRVNDEVWLPASVEVHLKARLLLLKSYNENLDFTYSDYKKFRTSIQVLPQPVH